MWAQVFRQVLLQAPRVIALVLIIPMSLDKKEKASSTAEQNKEKKDAE